ncbi:hypothetical protein VTN00DRAFT_5162 [Thermoascus crustaceus]|uniref:uncharacterized protein n=1 Tax=Thermoascus crustaceus TaxID=5088 RepID=UPI003742361F
MSTPEEERGKQIPLPIPPTPEIVSRPDENEKPWIQLGELDPKTTLTPPPGPVPGNVGPEERARMRFEVVGSVVLTGGAGMLALASARALLEHGAYGVALLDLPSALEKGRSAIERLRIDFPNARIATEPCDVTDAEGVEAAVQRVKRQLGKLDILCCFAGLVNCKPAEEMSIEEWRRMLDVNTTGSWIAAQAVGKHMIASGRGGKIVLVASISGHRVNYPQPQAAYNVSKAGILHMKNSLAAEWTRYGIRVNSISPGYMDTVLNAGEALAPWRQVWADRNPMRRMGTPQELTGPVVFLCSEIGGSYVNGADIVVDGGGLVF